jgi:ParB family chromosome partitioning protein
MPSFDDEETGESGPALMESGALATHRRQAGRFFHVNVELLDDSPYQPRRTYDEGALSALAESLRHFQEEAIVVKLKDNGRYELVSGHRRKRAAALAQIRSLEARLFERGDDEAAISALVTNEAREDLSDYERALSYRALLDSGRKGGAIKTQDQLGQRIGRGQSLVAKRLALLKLPKSILDLLDEFPRAVTVNSLAELNRVLATHPAEDRLIAELRRVAQGQISMATLASILVSSRATQAGVEQPRQSLSLQLGSRLFAQATPNHSKRQVMIKLPGECDLDEVAELVMDAIRVRYSGA